MGRHLRHTHRLRLHRGADGLCPAHVLPARPRWETEEEWEDPHREVVGTVTLVYPHHEHRLADTLADLQHRYHEAIVSSTHVHLDEDNCLEVVIVRGKSKRVRKIADALLSTRGVKHGGLIASTGGKQVK